MRQECFTVNAQKFAEVPVVYLDGENISFVSCVDLMLLLCDERIPEDDFDIVRSAGEHFSVRRPLKAIHASRVTVEDRFKKLYLII